MKVVEKRVGLLFGSFNPIHIGHLTLARYMNCFDDIDEVWLVISPQNPFKNASDLINEQLRKQMVDIALKDEQTIKSCDIEFFMPLPSFTIDTLKALKEKYSNYSFSLIMGTDNIKSINNWKSGDEILNNFKIYIYPRFKNFDSSKIEHPNVCYTNAPIVEISSTEIRENIAKGYLMAEFLHPGVSDFIVSNSLYIC
ncbi:MAG: nicotinate-nucleotide adenylyltransferase [Marinilabiliaceae bacterium]|nr:nicotinate-nucleotide adenylyltransferase [Marinilabiliaceae bacterium]